MRNVETNNINNKTNKLTNRYTNMEAEPANNSPKHIDVGNQAISITKSNNCRRQADVLTLANTNHRSTITSQTQQKAEEEGRRTVPI